MDLFNLNFGMGFGFVLLVDLAFAWHIIRTGRSPLWIMAVALGQMIGWIAYALPWLPLAATGGWLVQRLLRWRFPDTTPRP